MSNSITWKQDNTAQIVELEHYGARIHSLARDVWEIEVFQYETDPDDPSVKYRMRDDNGGYYLQGVVPSEVMAKMIAGGTVKILNENEVARIRALATLTPGDAT